MYVLDVFLQFWVETTDDSSLSVEQHSAKLRVTVTSIKPEVELLKYKESSFPALCLKNLTLIDENYPDQLYAKQRETVLKSTSLGKIDRKKLKFSGVIKPQKALDYGALPLQKDDPPLDGVSAPEKVSKTLLCGPFVDENVLTAAQKAWTIIF